MLTFFEEYNKNVKLPHKTLQAIDLNKANRYHLLDLGNL